MATGSSASDAPLLHPQTAENDLGGFDASFFTDEDMVIDPALLDIGVERMSDMTGEMAPPQSQSPAATSLGTRQESQSVPSMERTSSISATTTEKMLAGAMPHYDSGMQGLNRFLRLVSGGDKKMRRVE